MHPTTSSFAAALLAPGPAPGRGAAMDLYAWLIGAWEFDLVEFLPDGKERRRPGEWHFAWVLEGRAIQDVWMVPPRGAARAGDAATQANYYGSTLRTYDPRIEAWRIQWTDPVAQIYLSMIGRKEGTAIVQLGKASDGTLVRWSFHDISARSFVWRSELSADAGATWRLNVQFAARRLPSP